MPSRFTDRFVILIAAAVLGLPPMADAQRPQPEPITGRDAYGVYAELLPPLWANQSKDTMLIGEDTKFFQCPGAHRVADADWQSAWDSYADENSRGRRLLYMLPAPISYLLISTADMHAEGRRLVELYPGGWQRRPGQTDYAIVSAVGFNATKTRAIVGVNVGSSGSIHLVEKRDGHWGSSQTPGLLSCAWAA